MPDLVEYAVLDAGRSRIELGWQPRKRSVRPEGLERFIKVHGRVRAPEGEWQFRDKCLMVEEAERLCEWISGVSVGNAEPTISFLEPCLAFAASAGRRDLIAFRVRCKAEASPPWLWSDDHATWYVGYELELQVTPRQLGDFGRTLERLIGR
jgi:hypothetical protein